MSEKKVNAASPRGKASPPRDNVTVKPQKKSGLLGRIVRRFFLLLFTLILMVVIGLTLVMDAIFHGPSPAAQRVLTMSLLEPSATKWIPALFIGEDAVAEIRSSKGKELENDVSSSDKVVINKGSALSQASDEWEGHPDGIRIESYKGKTFNAHIMIVRDPSKVYLAKSAEKWSTGTPGTRMPQQMEKEGAIAGVNAGAFLDNGTAGPEVGSIPGGLVFAGGSYQGDWPEYMPPDTQPGFAGFDSNDILVVAKEMSRKQAEELGIRDGCEFGPVLIMDGEVNEVAYNSASGYNPRTGIGQRADGAVIFVCIDGRQTGSVGGTWGDLIDIMVEYGAVNACNMDGGSSSVMMYRDTQGLYGVAGTIQMINSYSLLQAEPRKMPDFWMVRPAE